MSAAERTLRRLLALGPTLFLALALAVLLALAMGAIAVDLLGGADDFRSQVASVVGQMQASEQGSPADASGLNTVTGPVSDCCSKFNAGAAMTVWGSLLAGMPLAVVGIVLGPRVRRVERAPLSRRWRAVVLAAATLQVGSIGAALLLILLVVSEAGVRLLIEPGGMFLIADTGCGVLALRAWMVVLGNVRSADCVSLKTV